jgi:hypothetical protein
VGFYNKSEGRYRLYTDAQKKQYGEEKREEKKRPLGRLKSVNLIMPLLLTAGLLHLDS